MKANFFKMTAILVPVAALGFLHIARDIAKAHKTRAKEPKQIQSGDSVRHALYDPEVELSRGKLIAQINQKGSLPSSDRRPGEKAEDGQKNDNQAETKGNGLSVDMQKILRLYPQLSRIRLGANISLQPETQSSAEYIGSPKCLTCHKKESEHWQSSLHSRMIQSVKQNPEAIVGDFSTLPEKADFSRDQVVYTIGGKFKQRYMLPSPGKNGSSDYVIGNHQWNTELRRWQPYTSYSDWYSDGFIHDSKQVPTSKTCDGCHFVGFMSREQRVELGISCESCHGPGSVHAKSGKAKDIYKATNSDPHRATEVCLQCHMRNRDKRLETMQMKDIFGDVRDYPKGYEPGLPLVNYKTQAPFEPGRESDEFFANGVTKKNRTQGNEFVRSTMYKHGITCVNCHKPHELDATTTRPLDNSLCMQCHAFGSIIGPHQKDLKSHARCGVYVQGNSCIECHMPKTGKHLNSSPVTVRTHIFGFITPNETRKYGVPNPCTSCHKDKDLEWAEDRLKEWGATPWK
jgi:hypothetical protein